MGRVDQHPQTGGMISVPYRPHGPTSCQSALLLTKMRHDLEADQQAAAPVSLRKHLTLAPSGTRERMGR